MFSEMIISNFVFKMCFFFLGNGDDGRRSVKTFFFFFGIFFPERKIQRKSPNDHTLVSLLLKCFRLENTEVHEILRSEHYAKR